MYSHTGLMLAVFATLNVRIRGACIGTLGLIEGGDLPSVLSVIIGAGLHMNLNVTKLFILVSKP